MAIRGHKPIPTELRLITATRDKHGKLTRERLTKNRPKVEPGIPDPPIELSQKALEEWNRIAPGLYTLGVLTRYDRTILFLYCQNWGRVREAEAVVAQEGLTVETKQHTYVQHPAVGIANSAGRLCSRYAAELGLTPSARSRISTTGLAARAVEEVDDFAELIG